MPVQFTDAAKELGLIHENHSQYTDESGNHYELANQVYNVGEHACVGCAFKFGNSQACRKAKTCTPSIWRNGNIRIFKGQNIWININK